MASQKGAMSSQKVEGAGLTIQSRKKGKGAPAGKGKTSAGAGEGNAAVSTQKTPSVAENFVVRTSGQDGQSSLLAHSYLEKETHLPI